MSPKTVFLLVLLGLIAMAVAMPEAESEGEAESETGSQKKGNGFVHGPLGIVVLLMTSGFLKFLMWYDDPL